MTQNHSTKCHVENRMDLCYEHTKLGINYIMDSCTEVEEITKRIHIYGYKEKKKTTEEREPTLH